MERSGLALASTSRVLISWIGIDEGVQITNRDALNLVILEYRKVAQDGRFIEFDQNIAVAIHAFSDGKPEMPWHERDWPVNVDIVLFEAILMGHFERVSLWPSVVSSAVYWRRDVRSAHWLPG